MARDRANGALRTFWRLRKGPKSPAPYKIAIRHPQTFLARMFFETALMFSRSVDGRLKDLAALRASSLAGCHW